MTAQYFCFEDDEDCESWLLAPLVLLLDDGLLEELDGLLEELDDGLLDELVDDGLCEEELDEELLGSEVDDDCGLELDDEPRLEPELDDDAPEVEPLPPCTPSAESVCESSWPLAWMPCCCWKLVRACWVFGPMMPSTGPGSCPFCCRACWACFTFSSPADDALAPWPLVDVSPPPEAEAEPLPLAWVEAPRSLDDDADEEPLPLADLPAFSELCCEDDLPESIELCCEDDGVADVDVDDLDLSSPAIAPVTVRANAAITNFWSFMSRFLP